MGSAVAITRLDLSASQLRLAAAKEKDATAARRILALALVLEGAERTTAARSCGMDRQTLRDWVHRYNREGLAGLRNRVSARAFPDSGQWQAQATPRLGTAPVHVKRGALISARDGVVVLGDIAVSVSRDGKPGLDLGFLGPGGDCSAPNASSSITRRSPAARSGMATCGSSRTKRRNARWSSGRISGWR